MVRHKDAAASGIDTIHEDLDKGLIERNKYHRLDPSQREINLTCDECGKLFKHYYLLMEHKASRHSGRNAFQCRKCNRLYPNRYYLTKHLKRHEDLERCGLSADQLVEDLDENLMERNKYVRSEPNQFNTSFDCDECGTTFSKFCFLTEHKRSKHSQEKAFRCRKCGRYYQSRYYLAKHMKRHENVTNSSDLVIDNSSDCDEDLIERKPYVRNHPHQPKSDFVCESCGMTYKRYELLKEHMISNHSSKESFMCKFCQRSYPNRYYLQKHMKRHAKTKTDEDEYNNLDKDLMERRRYIRVHPHRPTSNFECDICHKVLSSYYSIREHMHSKHSKKSKEKHTCPKCNKIFVSKKRLKKHDNLKHSDVPGAECAVKTKVQTKQMCSICGRLYPDRSKLLAHEKSHSGIMISCEICDKKFVHKNYLRKHIRSVHSRERPFVCNVDGCEWTFAYQQCFKRHQARRHGMVRNRNACPICSKEFPESTYHLKRHLKAHANNTAKEYIPEPKQDTAQPTMQT